MTRLGSKLPFREAAEEVWYSCYIRIGEATLRRITHRHGAAAAALVRQEVALLEREAPEVTAYPQQLLLSADGAFVQLTNGEWREVKSVVVGEFTTGYDLQNWTAQVKTHKLSYFSRSCGVREFEHEALAELHRRGVENAQTLVAINDGAEWIQSFLDYHSPKAIRIIDFAHAASYLAQAGKAAWGEESETFQGWFAAACHRLKYQPPQETLANLRLLQPKTKERRTERPHRQRPPLPAEPSIDARLCPFRRRGYPIGSGSVESGHKVVV